MILDTTAYGSVTLGDLLVSGIILLIAVLITRIIALYARRTFKNMVERDLVESTIKVISYIILGLAIISILPIVGVNPAGFLVAGGILAIVIGFASQSIVGNLISGLFLMIERPIKIGDTVNIEGVTGYVEEIRIISISIRSYDGVYVRIPNEKVFTGNITNYLANVARRFEYMVGIRYSDDADRAIEIIQEIIEAEPFALKNPAPTIFVHDLGDNAVNISVKIWSPSTEWWGVRTKLLWIIKKTLEEQGIEIAFPQRTVWFANPLESGNGRSRGGIAGGGDRVVDREEGDGKVERGGGDGKEDRGEPDGSNDGPGRASPGWSVGTEGQGTISGQAAGKDEYDGPIEEKM